MIKSDNIVKTGTRFKLRKQQSTYRESHDDDGGDWNGAGTASRIHSGIEAQARFTLFYASTNSFHSFYANINTFSVKMVFVTIVCDTYTSL